MATRLTRGAAAKQAAQQAAVGKENFQQQSSNAIAQPKKGTVAKKPLASKNGGASRATIGKIDANAQSTTTSKTLSAKTASTRKTPGKTKDRNAVKETSESNEATGIETAPEKPNHGRMRSAKVQAKDTPPASTMANKKRKRTSAPKAEEDPDELPHGLGKLWKPTDPEAQTIEGDIQEHPAKKQAIAVTAVIPEEPSPPVVDPIKASADAVTTISPEDSPAKKSRKKKAHPYGLTPGITPFPDWPYPTPSECQKVNDLLSTIHGNVTAPATIPEPSLAFAGCGEVPCVLDALIRTYLSSATSGDNSSRAFKGLLDEYGKQETGIGKGSINWDAVRRSDVSRVFNAIRSGGLAATKSRNIKKILDMVYEENQAHRATLAESKDSEIKNNVGAIDAENTKVMEIVRAHSHHLSLDHLHAMTKDTAFNHMLRYPGIGVKTASCVTLFCLRRPSFAVDTHVFRLCQWLGWVPATATRDTTFQHCEVRVPEGLKYSLHQLLIMHGKKCGRCRAVTGESSSGWGDGCVIDHLVTRTGLRKGGEASPKKGMGKGKGKGKVSPAKGKGEKRKRGEEEDDNDNAADDDDGEGEEKMEKSPAKGNGKGTKRKRGDDNGDDEDGKEVEKGSEMEENPKKAKVAKTSPKKTPTKSKREKNSKVEDSTTTPTKKKTPTRSKVNASKSRTNQRNSVLEGE